MKTAKLFLAGSTMTLLLTGVALAEAPQLRQPSSIQQTAFEYDDYLSWAPSAAPSASPSDAPPKPEPAANEPNVAGSSLACCDPACECDNGCEPKCRWCRCGKLEDPWTLPLPQAMKCRDITIGGWLSGGGYVNSWGDESNGPLGFRNLATGSADQLWIYAERKVNTKESIFDWGFRADYVYGIDGPDTQCFGDQSWDYNWNSSRDYGSAIPQAYVEVGWNDLTIKGGHFYTPIGYEVVPATGRFFYSTAYTMYYAEPFTHTGVLATYQMTEKLAGSLGWTDGWDGGWENRNGASTILGGLTWKPGDRLSLAWYFNAGRFGDGRYGGNAGDVYMQSVVATLNLTERWTYVLQSDYGYNYNLPGNTTHTEWYGINQYLFYKLNDCLSVGGRFEWFRDDDGARVLNDGLGRTIGNPGNYYELTFGLNYKPHANITIRPELRYDKFDGQVDHSAPFDRGHADDQLSGGFDVIFTY